MNYKQITMYEDRTHVISTWAFNVIETKEYTVIQDDHRQSLAKNFDGLLPFLVVH